jgi:hypothetical protein
MNGYIKVPDVAEKWEIGTKKISTCAVGIQLLLKCMFIQYVFDI